VRDLKIEQILEWRSRLLQDGRVIASDPVFRAIVDRWVANPNDPATVAALRSWMAVIQEVGGNSGVALMSPDGSRWLSTTDKYQPDTFESAEASKAQGSNETVLTDLFLDPVSGEPRLDVVAPLVGGQKATRAVVVLNRDPNLILFPLLQKWPSISPSSETLLLRPDKDRILYLNDLRFRADSALRFSLPISDSSLLAVKAATGPTRATEGRDYRGVPVLGAVGRVGDTPWYLVAKVDRAEAFSALTQRQWLITIVAFLLVGLVGLALAFTWRQRTVEFYRQQLEAERSQALLSQQYGLLTRYASDAVILADDELRIVQANERAVALYGYPEEELVLLTLDDLLAPDLDGLTTTLGTALHGDSGDLIHVKQRRADGSFLDAEMTTRSMVVDGQTLYMTITRDATERIAAERALEENRALLQSVIGSTPDAIYVKDLDGRYLLFNHGAEAITGKSSQDVIGRNDSFLFPAQEAEIRMAGDQDVIAGGVTVTRDEDVTGADGMIHHFSATKGPLFGDGGRPRGLFGFSRDITARVNAEEALSQSEEMHRTLLDNLPAGVVVHGPDTAILFSNPMASELLGLSEDQLNGRTAMDPTWHFLREGGEVLPLEEYPVNQVVSSGQALENLVVGVIRPARTEPAWLLANAYPVRDASGDLVQVVVAFTDITDRKRATEELAARTEDLARSNADLERFAYIASHDLQEPLRMVASYTQLLQRRYQGRLDSDADEFIGYAVDGATRMQRLINELLVYSRVGSQGSAFVETDLESVLADVLQVLTISIAESGADVTHDRMPTVVCDSTQIGQVFQNLISNAIKFHGVDLPRIHVGVESSGDEWVFSVKDNGLGIEPEYFDRIFVIFQRLQSRADYPGTGMGLAICKRIIERHGGRTWVESGEGIGSTFYFTLAAKGKDHHVG
jgi:PAS domain S-box-containing protein